jgi:hypothetical protein
VNSSVWQNGLLVALLVWLLTSVAYNRGVIENNRADDAGQVSSPSPMREMLPRPWSPLSRSGVGQVRFLTCFVCLLVAVGLFVHAAGYSLGNAAPVGVILIAGIYFDPTALDFRRAPFELPLLALLCAAYFFDSHDRPFRMAVCLAFAGIIQVWMLALLLYPLARRKPLATVFGLAMFAGMLTLLLVGSGYRTPAAFVDALRALWSGSSISTEGNQSIFGLAKNFLAPDPEAPLLMYAAVAVGFVVILSGLWYASGRVPIAGSDHARLVLGLTVVSLLLCVPVNKRSDFLLLLPALWTLLIGEKFSPFVLAIAIVSYAALADSELIARFEYIFFVAAVAIWAALLMAIGQVRRRPTHSLPCAFVG